MASYIASPASNQHIHSHDHNDHHRSPSLSSTSNRISTNTKGLKIDPPHDNLIANSNMKSSLHEYANASIKSHRQNYYPYLPSPPNSTKSQPTLVVEAQAHSTIPLRLSPLSLESPKDPINFSIVSQKHKDHCENHSHHHENPSHQHKNHSYHLENHSHQHENYRHQQKKKENHGHEHNQTNHVESRSKFTNRLLPMALKWPLIRAILMEKDSRRIFYFMSLNFAFMLVQAFYGYLTDSLGLLSDSIHMFFDCLALGVGLFAAIASKWPPSQKFPYGFTKIESLSGFGNGVFLILISIEIIIEAIERLAEGRETKRLAELLIVSSLGLVVNLVGMACFGHHHHGHAGHDHGEKCHSHSHSHSHSHAHTNSHSHSSGNKETPSCSTPNYKSHAKSDDASLPHTHNEPQNHMGHSHSHDDDNMHGIFLHVLADTMGSAAVIVSTLLIYLTGNSSWDPIASCIIAILIFLSSVPLIKKSAKKLLLTVPDEVEYTLRDTFAGVSDLRGVSNYYAPRFWVCDNDLGEKESVLGVIHIAATRGSDLDEVRERTQDFFWARGIDAVVQVEENNDQTCWCGRTNTLRSSLKT
ncbi:hypothetical protein K3495_g3856 [Podosphaera aphanis]|nr:hypothetical protein K3495_g3856 [Podosphaera aphanis]